MEGSSREELARRIERGEYVVDPHAVADAILRRGLGVLETAEPVDGASCGVEQDETAPGPDLA
jgi:hypothetical protein